MGLIRLRVSPAAERALRGGHPWVYEGSIREQARPGQTGDLAVVYDRQNRFLALGLLDPDSPLRLRVLQAGQPAKMDAAWWRARLERALQRREGMFGPDTTGYRLIHGESDGWPGLVLDRYGDSLVLKLYTAAWFPHLPAVLEPLRRLFPAGRLVGRLGRLAAESGKDAPFEDGAVLWGEDPQGEPVPFLEHGLSFEAAVQKGQKTGFFLDQRDNRRLVESWADGGAVLNLFSFTGGFSLAAARGGAVSVTDVDLSAHALEGGKRNFALNRAHRAVAGCRREAVKADVFAWLAERGERRYDLVVVDPPSLARREKEQEKALQAYEWLAVHALSRLRPGGLLVAASCSAHVTPEAFFERVWRAVTPSGVRAEVVAKTGQPADHPATFPEARYLKCVSVRVGGRV